MKREDGTMWVSLAREIRLRELMKLIPGDEFVMIFKSDAGQDGFREEDAIFNGQVFDWWVESVATPDMLRMYVLGFQARETETVVGPVIMIVVDP